LNKHAPVVRQGLKVIAKIIQNLANNIFFGKEPHMMPLNKFLESNITNVTRYLSELHVSLHPLRSDVLDVTSFRSMAVFRMISMTTGLGRRPTNVFHRFFQKHADRIGKELLSHSSGIDVNCSTVTGKQIWDNLCALLVDLGPPLEVPRLSILDSSSRIHVEIC
jgi:hypothetical protein